MSKFTIVLLLVTLVTVTIAKPQGVNVVDGDQQVNVVDDDSPVNVVDGDQQVHVIDDNVSPHTPSKK